MSEIRGVRAAVFDLDGTLFDSVGLWHEIDEIFLRKRGFEPTDEYKRSIAALGFRATAYFTVEYFGLDETPETLMDEWNELAEYAYKHTIKLFDGVCEYLTACAAEGIRIFAVTSLKRELVESCLESNGVRRFFEEIITADETGMSKSTPDIYEYAAKRAGCAAYECVAFDDVHDAINAAKAAGMKTVAISRADGLFGAHDGADFIVDGVAKAPKLIRRV